MRHMIAPTPPPMGGKPTPLKLVRDGDADELAEEAAAAS
jgi:hypothetical protein